jgi:NADPH-dependent curcumin reductase CurA
MWRVAIVIESGSVRPVNRRWILSEFPRGALSAANFRWDVSQVAEPSEGQVLVRNLYLSLDPTNRIWASGSVSYLPAMKLGAVMRGVALGVVMASRDTRLAVGDCVTGLLGWQDYVLVKSSALSPVPRDTPLPLTDYLGVLGSIGLTAYFGLLDLGRPREGETVLVSAAAGAVGSLVGQIARIKGCRTVGLVGSSQKARWITEELGFDGAINYRDEDVPEAIARQCPAGVDVYFDNVGGPILDAAMGRLNLRGRIVLCGLISQYNSSSPVQELRNLGGFLVQRGRMEAFIVIDYLPRASVAYAEIAEWVQRGQIRYRTDVVQGLERAPAALGRLFDGTNQGKLLVQIVSDPEAAVALARTGAQAASGP